MTPLAYHADPALKAKYVARVKAHRDADELIHGIGWEDGKGCAIGCLLEKYDHSRGPTELGVPVVLMRLADAIFEGLANGDAQSWATDWIEAIPVGADLSMVWPRFALDLLSSPESAVVVNGAKRADVKVSIEGVAALYREWVETGVEPSRAMWAKARADATRAAATAATAATTAAAYTASAAYAAGAAASEWRRMRDVLLSLLRSAPAGVES